METRSPLSMSPRARAWFDRILVAGLLGFSLFLELAGSFSSDSGVPRSVILLLMTAQVVPLLWRRSRPELVLGLVVAAHLAQVVVFDDMLPSQFAAPIVAYSAARWGNLAARVAVVPLALVGAVLGGVRWTLSWNPDWKAAIPTVIVCATVVLIGWALGVAAGQRDRFLAALVERAESRERMAERDVALAAQDERARIAREMHDVVAHGLSVIVVQADGARYAAAKDPQVAVDTLETIASTGRDSLAEMRRLLGLLRSGDSGVRPQPTLADVPHLVAEAAATGADVTADLADPLPAVSDGVGLAAYRFVQEALTNVRKHAGPGARVHVLVGVGQGALVLRVDDDGRGAAAQPPVPGTGHGLVGMRERIGVHGGTVRSGPLSGGGWSVGARIPL